jgi:polyketide cyclase/dehydrase/lipid transport protein
MAQHDFHFRTQTSVRSEAPPGAVFDTITDLRAHLEWSGERAADDGFKLLELDAPPGRAVVGIEFTSTGANFNGTFHDRSVISAADRPRLFVIDTDAHLDRKHGKPWDVHFEHRYDVERDGEGSRITYTETISRLNYVPYWLRWWMRPISRAVIDRADRKQLQNLAQLAEQRSGA